MKNKNNSLQILITVFCVFLLTFNLKAQIEDFKVGTTTRKMLVYAPSGIKENSPLLLSLHGMNQDIYYQQNQTKWETLADANNFVLVYPAGINNSWDLSGTSDTDFILAIINEMYKRYGIDRDRVYLSGFSMGGMMTYHAMNIIADKIAAFAPVSGYLMGGPNTNSSRPVPIIHTHGSADDVVPFSGVQTCLNAWITRDKCPKTAVVTKPYPANKPNSSGTKYYWGRGTDNVEIVLMRIEGAGHWHSIDPNGINTSLEIWNFCKNYTLAWGIPKFVLASVTNNNPKQIQVNLSLPITKNDNYQGFTVKIDGQLVAIDNVVLADSTQLLINLSDSIKNDNEITLSYNNGNVVSIYAKKLANFNDKSVENLLTGASPRIVELATNENGDSLRLKFNMKMKLPADISNFKLSAEFNGNKEIPILKSSFYNNDSTSLVFVLDEKVYADYKLLFSFNGNNVSSSDSGLLKIFTDTPVKNNSKGLPVHINSGIAKTDGSTIVLAFSKPMAMVATQMKYFALLVNSTKASLKSITVSSNTINFTLTNNLHYGDIISMSYTPGNVTSADKGSLEAFSNITIVNQLSIPTWYSIPGKTEAENYALQYGTDKEQTSDTGGGMNVGWIETGDWLEYAIENNTTNTDYEISFRLAAQAAGGQFSYYVDNVKIAQVTVPNTGGWQTWQSVVKPIKIDQGKHYLKIVAVTGGFNINYFDIQKSFTGVSDLNIYRIGIYPNPASNQVVIQSTNFRYDSVEIFDMMGKTVMSKSIPYVPELHLPVSLTNGVYIVKISNGQEFQEKRIVINKN